MQNIFTVKKGRIYLDGLPIGDSESKPGFDKYYFEDKELGSGANAVTYRAKHKFLNTTHIVKIYKPKESESDHKKAHEESIKNANVSLQGIIAIVHDAGEYCYPKRIEYSIMENISNSITIKEWKDINKNYESIEGPCYHFGDYFNVRDKKFDITDMYCKAYIKTSLNIIAGILKAVIKLYQRNIIHGDLNHGNILWIIENESLADELFHCFSSGYSVNIGKLTPYNIKLIDMGASAVNPNKEAGKLRDVDKIYDLTKYFLKPLFKDTSKSLKKWFVFNSRDNKELKEEGVAKEFLIYDNGSQKYVNPKELAGDIFRLICVLSFAFGFIETEGVNTTEKSIILKDPSDCGYFNLLMCGCIGDQQIDVFSVDVLSVLEMLESIDSHGCLINWHEVWNTYPLNMIDSKKLMNI